MTKSKKKIVVIGSINMDLVSVAERMPKPGETILGEDFFTSSGGKGANQAVAAARLGGDVTMIGCVGSDIYGKELIKNLKNNNVNVKGIEIIHEAKTGCAIVSIDRRGENSITVHHGANSKVSAEIIRKNRDVISAADIVLLQFEIPLDAVKEALEFCKNKNVKVILDPAPALSGRYPKEIYYADILTPNETEISSLLKIKEKSLKLRSKSAEQKIRLAAGELGIKNIIIKAGTAGAYFYNEIKLVCHAARKIKPVDTTGAGDTFNGALSVAISEGMKLNDAIAFANSAAALACLKYGAQSSMPYRNELNDYL